MSWLDGLRHRVRTLLRPAEFERELKEELELHKSLQDANGGGRLGNRTMVMESVRGQTLLAWSDLVRQDVTYAWRSIRRTPGVAATVVITLALGVGVNGAVFSVLDQLYLRYPAGVVEPEGIRRIWTRFTTVDGKVFNSLALTYPQYRTIADQWGEPSTLAVTRIPFGFRLGGTRAGRLTMLAFTTGNYFTLLGVGPDKGRLFTQAESQPGAASRQVVLSHRYWQSALGGDESIIGKRIKLDTLDWEVIGVAQAGFDGIDRRIVDAWAPLGSVPGADERRFEGKTLWDTPRMATFTAFGRPGTSVDEPQFEHRATNALRVANAETLGKDLNAGTVVRLGNIIEARGPRAADRDEMLAMRLQLAACIALLIATTNIANLLLVRTVSRRREIAVRLALGISRVRLIRLITIESCVLAALASVVAGGAAWAGGRMLQSLLLPDIKFAQSAFQPRVFGVTLLVALATGLVAGVVPALRFSRPDLTLDLKDGVRGARRYGSRIQTGLVVAQAALSLTLLSGAALVTRSLQNVEGVDIGYDRSQVTFVWMAYDPGTMPAEAEQAARVSDVEAQLRGRNGVLAVGTSAMLPMGGFIIRSFWWGADSSRSLNNTFPFGYAVGPGYFDAAGLRLLAGRTFTAASDGEVVVNLALAKLLWPRDNAVGQCMHFESRDAACTVVTGVVTTATTGDILEAPRPQYYLPIGSALTKQMGGNTLVVRARRDAAPAALADAIALLKQALPKGYPQTMTMADLVEPKYRSWRLSAELFTALGALALLVAVVGIYSSVAYSVNQRTHEFGVRVALGAQVRDVLDLVVGEGVRVVSIGIAVGIVLAYASTRFVASLLYGVEPTDLSAMILASAILLLAALAASVIPAWRAARVDPVGALRGE